MKQRVGIIGASGDLGSQLAVRIRAHGHNLRTYSRTDPDSTLVEIVKGCEIIHICAPVEAARYLLPTNAIVVLHDSVMHTSRQASERYLHGHAAIVHMLMNDSNTVVIASNAPHHDVVGRHFTSVGLTPRSMTVEDHDYMIARSQAPLALLCKTLLPYLYKQADRGLLTPSGQLLVNTLRSRELAWTDATVHSILQNPQLQSLINDLQEALDTHKDKS